MCMWGGDVTCVYVGGGDVCVCVGNKRVSLYKKSSFKILRWWYYT